MNTKIVLGTAAARGLEGTPLMLDMARVGKLLVCADDEEARMAEIRQIARDCADCMLWHVRDAADAEGDGWRIINAKNPNSVTEFLDELAGEYDRRTALASMDGLTEEDALFVVIDNLGDIVRAINRWETQGLLQCFGPGDTDYPAHGIYLIAGLDIDTLGYLGKKRFQLYNCLDHFSVSMMVGDELTGDKKRTVCDFFGERVGTMIADGTATQNAGFLIDFFNHPTPFVYQAR